MTTPIRSSGSPSLHLEEGRAADEILESLAGYRGVLSESGQRPSRRIDRRGNGNLPVADRQQPVYRLSGRIDSREGWLDCQP